MIKFKKKKLFRQNWRKCVYHFFI